LPAPPGEADRAGEAALDDRQPGAPAALRPRSDHVQTGGLRSFRRLYMWRRQVGRGALLRHHQAEAAPLLLEEEAAAAQLGDLRLDLGQGGAVEQLGDARRPQLV